MYRCILRSMVLLSDSKQIFMFVSQTPVFLLIQVFKHYRGKVVLSIVYKIHASSTSVMENPTPGAIGVFVSEDF